MGQSISARLSRSERRLPDGGSLGFAGNKLRIKFHPIREAQMTGTAMTVIQAILKVMRDANRPMSPRDVFAGIAARNLYVFRAKDPASIVRTTMRRHSVDCPDSSASSIAYLRLQGRDTYTLLPEPEKRVKDLTHLARAPSTEAP